MTILKVDWSEDEQLFKKCDIPGLFFVFFHLFKQTLQIVEQIYVKNVPPVYGVGIQTHNPQNMSLLPLPQDHGEQLLPDDQDEHWQ